MLARFTAHPSPISAPARGTTQLPHRHAASLHPRSPPPSTAWLGLLQPDGIVASTALAPSATAPAAVEAEYTVRHTHFELLAVVYLTRGG